MKKLFLILSSITCCLMLSPANTESLIIYTLIGTALPIFMLKIQKAKRKKTLISVVISVAITFLFVFAARQSFISHWLPSSQAARVAEKLSSIVHVNSLANINEFLNVVSIFLMILSLPFVFFVISSILRWIYVPINSKVCVSTLKESFSVKCCLKYLLLIVISCAIGFVLLLIVFCLPVDTIDSNLSKSATDFAQEGGYPRLQSWCTSQLDNFTDSIMMLSAADNSSDSLVERALMIYRDKISGETNWYNIFIDHYVKGVPFDGRSNYARYWHGYLIWLKPLLLAFSYQSIRVINSLLQIITVALICFLFVRRHKMLHALAYLIMYLMLMPEALGKSLQYSSCFYSLNFGVILLLSLYKDRRDDKKIPIIFAVIGIMTAYFDFLTYPIATYGVPAIVALSLINQYSNEDKLCLIVKTGISWIVGYVGMWASKWMLATILTKNNVLSNAVDQVVFRTSGELENMQFSVFSCITDNLNAFFRTPFSFLAAAFCIVIFILIRRKRHFAVKQFIFAYVIIGISPLLWYAFALNHSSIHSWFTNKSCAVLVIAIMFLLADSFEGMKDMNEQIRSNG